MADYEIFALGNVVLQSGLTLRNAQLAYKTYGTLNSRKDNAIVYPTILALGLALAATNAGGFLEHLEAAAALGAFLLIFALIARSGFGMGDVKVGFLLGLALGSRTLSAMMIAFFGLFLAALWILARNGLSARKQAIPFGPFLAVGAIAAFFLT